VIRFSLCVFHLDTKKLQQDLIIVTSFQLCNRIEELIPLSVIDSIVLCGRISHLTSVSFPTNKDGVFLDGSFAV